MKTIVRLAVAGALAASTAAHAQPALPSTDASDLWIFVADPSASKTFVLDTGIPLASLMPSGSLVTGATLSTAIDDTSLINAAASFTPTAQLTAFINAANTAGQPLEWGVLGVNYPGTDQRYTGAGQEIVIFDNPGATSTVASTNPGKMFTFAQGFTGDATYFIPGYTTGGTTYLWSAGTTAGNVWGAGGAANAAGSTNLYGTEPNQAVNAAGTAPFLLGQAAPLYGVTGNGSTGQAQSYVLANLELTSTGSLQALSSVPLPAAVWLFGSGLLGLIGVGRRRSSAAA
jgi:hypothetical protein